MGDQFFFASLLERKRLGVQCGTNLSELTKENVIQAIQLAQNDSVIKANCKRIRKELFALDNNHGGEKQEKYGVPRMADLLEKIYSKDDNGMHER
jgi:UDP:flavonoid glycosyltransferase YjiC (YdhE family)